MSFFNMYTLHMVTYTNGDGDLYTTITVIPENGGENECDGREDIGQCAGYGGCRIVQSHKK